MLFFVFFTLYLAVATDNSTTFPKDTDVISENYSLPSVNSHSPPGCQNSSYSCLSLNGDAGSSNDTGSLDSYLSHPKFKQTILQRYLNDHTGFHVDTITSTRDRRVSGSLCSRDYEEMSTTSSSSRANGNNPNVFEGKETVFLKNKKIILIIRDETERRPFLS